MITIVCDAAEAESAAAILKRNLSILHGYNVTLVDSKQYLSKKLYKNSCEKTIIIGHNDLTNEAFEQVNNTRLAEVGIRIGLHRNLYVLSAYSDRPGILSHVQFAEYYYKRLEEFSVQSTIRMISHFSFVNRFNEAEISAELIRQAQYYLLSLDAESLLVDDSDELPEIIDFERAKEKLSKVKPK